MDLYYKLDIRELRVGSWYLSAKFQIPVICELADFYELHARLDGAKGEPEVDEIFKPLPLTEEWFKKFGFEKNGFEWRIRGSEQYLYYRFLWDQFRGYFFYIEMEGTVSYTYHILGYVHELQNLYYILTGNELK